MNKLTILVKKTLAGIMTLALAFIMAFGTKVPEPDIRNHPKGENHIGYANTIVKMNLAPDR